MRTRVALQYGLPLDLASRLRGDDEEALKQDAENLAGLMHANEPKAPLKSTEPTVTDDKGWAQMTRQLTEH